MTPDATRALASTIRSLRESLVGDPTRDIKGTLHDATESVYRLALPIHAARLDDAAAARRRRLESWIDEQLRAQTRTQRANDAAARTAEDFRREAEKQAAYTLLNRLVILRLMEASGPNGEPPLRTPAVMTGGWESPGYQQFRQVAPAFAHADETEGYAYLLRLVFEDLATELPGLYGPAGVADLIPIPASTLRHVVETLGDEDLEACWIDDMTLGWIYQYWNDPEREALDAKLKAKKKLAPHEIASKTQMFTERYMVDWLLQNTLGPMWLAMCRRHEWIAEVDAGTPSVLQQLDRRRAEWRAKRDSGEVSLTDLMPVQTDIERHWAYFVPQPMPDDAVAHAPDTVRDLRVLDPAVGSGHFLVVAMDLLLALYREEARHRDLADHPDWTDRAIVERILSYNLHGIDVDPRAVQIAAAALWLKARRTAPDAHPERLNLVASNLSVASLDDDDPALVELRREVEEETGIPAAMTDQIVQALRGADHLGTLLKVDSEVERAIRTYEETVAPKFAPQQGHMYRPSPEQQGQIVFEAEAAKRSLVDRLETFLAHHTGGDDLGLRLRGEQLAAGVRFVRLVREDTYDLVVANPPYQGTSKMADARYVEDHYQLGKADLYAAFLVRGLQLVRPGGTSSMVTMRSWLFIKQFAALREDLLSAFDLRALGDFAIGAFDEVPNDLLSVTASVLRKSPPVTIPSVAAQPTPPDDRSYDRERTKRKRAATLCHVGRHDFEPSALKIVPEWPLVYWWTKTFLDEYRAMGPLKDLAPAQAGLQTSNDTRFIRHPWEIQIGRLLLVRTDLTASYCGRSWVPLIKGAEGKQWIEPLGACITWDSNGLQLRLFPKSYPRNMWTYFRLGIAFTDTGNNFSARLHRFASIPGDKGPSCFPGLNANADVVCLLNRQSTRTVISALNPGLDFQVGDVNRVPAFHINGANQIVGLLEECFEAHESCREPSVEFRHPGPSQWRCAQKWAQTAVDRPDKEPLPPYEPQYDPEPPTDHLSYALGVALGRFGPDGEGILDPATADLSHALPDGVLFLDLTLDTNDERDSLGHPATAPLKLAWDTHRAGIDTRHRTLRQWLALDFFKDVHKGMYENCPIHWPLSSKNRTFVAWINIHRFTDRTLRVLLADHLDPARKTLDGRLADLRAARNGADTTAVRAADKAHSDVLNAREELEAFIKNIEQCADRGASRPDAKCTPREQDARYELDLDDGVMINSAGLWPLLEAQWKDPKKWWRELSEAKGKKDYDWSHLAMRYWPARVDDKCKTDPALSVAHGCFWRYHPARAWEWELRLQDEIAADYRIDEPTYRPGGRDVGDTGSSAHREAWLRDHAEEAAAAVDKEMKRRARKTKQSDLVDLADDAAEDGIEEPDKENDGAEVEAES